MRCAMKDEEFEELVSNGNPSVAVISPCKLKGDIKNVLQIDLGNEKYNKRYLQVAEELARRIFAKGFSEEKEIEFEKLSRIEQEAVKMIRNDSTLDNEHLKGDFVISNFLEIERIKQKRSVPPQKRLQLNDEKLRQFFQLKAQNVSIREISRTMGISRGTIYKVLQKNYVDERDVNRVIEAEKEVIKNQEN